MKQTHFFMLCGFLFFCVISCNSSKSSQKKKHEPKSLTSKDAPPENLPSGRPVEKLKHGDGARVVVDISGSMKGFTSSKSVVLETLHRVIDEVLSVHGMNVPLERCLLGKELDCKQKLRYADYLQAKLYTAESSRLDLVLLRPVKPAGDNPAAPPPPDMLDPYHITVILTDGMQAASNTNAGSVSADKPVAANIACASGADPMCIARLLQVRREEGYGIWVLFIRLPFNGAHYAERMLDDSHWQKIDSHIQQLKKDPEWYGFNITAKNLRMSLKDKTSYFQYEGAKPLLFFILSRDWEKGRAFTRDLYQRFQAEKIGKPEQNGLFFMELSPYGYTDVTVTKIFKAGPKTKKSDDVFLRPAKTPGERQEFDWMIECRENSRAVIQVSLSTSLQGPALPNYVTETLRTVEVKPEGTKKNFPAKYKKKLDDRSIAFQTGVDCSQKLESGTYYFDFMVNIERKMVLQSAEDVWWKKHSSENTYEMPERVYGLASVVQTVTDPVFNQVRPVRRIRFKLVKE